MNKRGPAILVLFGGTSMAAGALFPWTSQSGVSAGANGVLVLVAGVVAGLLGLNLMGLLGKPSTSSAYGAGFAALLGGLICVGRLLTYSSPGAGLWLSLVGTMLVGIGCFFYLRES